MTDMRNGVGAVDLMIGFPSADARSQYTNLRAMTKDVDYANSRGADKVMYAGYYPMGLSLRRIHEEMQNVPLKDEVIPKFLRENAMRVFKLGDQA